MEPPKRKREQPEQSSSRKELKFYRTTGPYGCFSNFSRHPIKLDGKDWPTSEHYFQAQKFVGTLHAEEIRKLHSPMEAAQAGRDRRRPLRADWDTIKDDIMRKALRAKFMQHEECKQTLLGTDNGDGTGRNRLGELLMELRAELRSSEEDVVTKILRLTNAQRQGKKFILIIGPPCVGKTTLCKNLAEKLSAAQLSMGELLREYGKHDKQVQALIDAGKQVCSEIKRKILCEAIVKRIEATLVIDGYLELGLLEELEATLLYLHCPDEQLKERFAARKTYSNRNDDSTTQIEVRIQSWHEVHDSLLKHYEASILKLDASGTSSQLLKNTLEKLTFMQ